MNQICFIFRKNNKERKKKSLARRTLRHVATDNVAIKDLANNSGTQFEPKVVNAFLEIQRQSPIVPS